MGDHQNYGATLETIMTLKDSQYKKIRPKRWLNSRPSTISRKKKREPHHPAAVRPAPKKIIYSTRLLLFSICFNWRDGSCSGATNEEKN